MSFNYISHTFVKNMQVYNYRTRYRTFPFPNERLMTNSATRGDKAAMRPFAKLLGRLLLLMTDRYVCAQKWLSVMMPRRCCGLPEVWWSGFKTSSTTSESIDSAHLYHERAPARNFHQGNSPVLWCYVVQLNSVLLRVVREFQPPCNLCHLHICILVGISTLYFSCAWHLEFPHLGILYFSFPFQPEYLYQWIINYSWLERQLSGVSDAMAWACLNRMLRNDGLLSIQQQKKVTKHKTWHF